MKSLADALVYSVSYINCRAVDDDDSDDDVGALESIAAFLHTATPAEEDALAAAAQRAHIAEQAAPSSRPNFIEDYGCWMENMFGDGWKGNRRAPINE